MRPVVCGSMHRRLSRSFAQGLLVLALSSSPLLAAKGPYVDTKHRFELALAPGWDLAPLPGDPLGMNFRRLVGGVPASLHVMVTPAVPGQTVKDSLDKAEAGFKVDLGYNPGVDTPVELNGMPGMKRTLTVFASGDKSTVRFVELYVVHAFGYVHTLHYETLESKKKTFARDLDKMLTTYVPIVGKGVSGALSGSWINTGGGPDLTLDDDGSFLMGPLNGGWSADGGKLVMKIPAGSESYRYVHNGDTLTLSSPNLGGDLVFRRASTPKRTAPLSSAEKAPKQRSGELTKEELYGTWTVLDPRDSDPLKLQLASSGSVAFGGLSGRWRYSTGRLTIRSTAGETMTYACSMTNGQLVLSSGDLDKELVLTRD